MPNLYTIPIDQGDMLLVAGKIYELDDEGNFRQVDDTWPQPADKSGWLNDDGQQFTCAQIAFGHLGIDPSFILDHRILVEGDSLIPWNVIESFLSSCSEEMTLVADRKQRVGDFIREHPVGKFFVATYPTPPAPNEIQVLHIFALVEGTAFNLRWATTLDWVYRAWRIPDSTDTAYAFRTMTP